MKPFLVISMLMGLLFACSRSREVKTEPYRLSDHVDSVVYGDLKFGITRNQFLKRFSTVPQQNIMTEVLFDTSVVEVEGSYDLSKYHFIVYHYFDLDDSLYRVRAEYRTQHNNEYKDASMAVAKILYDHYGIPKRWNAVVNSYKFSWDLKNKQIFLETGCFLNNCLVEVTITELRLFIRNRDRIIPD